MTGRFPLDCVADFTGIGNNPTAGIELTRAIRQRGCRVPIIIYTLEVPEPLESLVHQAGVDRVTVDTAELYRWLERIGI